DRPAAGRSAAPAGADRARSLPFLPAQKLVAEADGNRTHQVELLGFTGFEDREGHQAPVRLHPARYRVPSPTGQRTIRTIRHRLARMSYRLTQYAHGGGCACKIPPGELEELVAGLVGVDAPDLLVGLAG